MFASFAKSNRHYLKIAAAIAAGMFIYFNIKAIILCTVLIGGVYYIVKAYQNCDAAYAQR